MGAIISFANQKGGIGKTTSAINVSAAVAKFGKKVLLVDCDPQGNTTSGVGLNKKKLGATTYDVLIGRSLARDAIVKTNWDNLWAIPTNISLAGAEVELIDLERRAERLRDALAPVKDDFDYIFIDCPPSLGIITICCLTASDGVVIPMQCEYFALEGLSQLMVTLRHIKNLYNERLEIVGILITMYNGRLNLSLQALAELKKYYSDRLFSEIIPRTVRVSEAPSYGTPVCYYDKNGAGAKSYDIVAKEVIARMPVL